MPTNTWVALDKKTVTTAVNEITFDSIPQTYTDLVIICSSRYTSTNVGQGLGIRLNGDTGTRYSTTILEGDGSTRSSYRSSNATMGNTGAVANSSQNHFSQTIIHINNYADANTYKNYLFKNNGPTYIQAGVGYWRPASAGNITSVTLLAQGTAGNIGVDSTFALFGVKAHIAESSPKATGGYVYSDSSYYYHSFPFSSTFTPNQSLTADILVIAGGGGAGNSGDRGSGGGGAGGLLAFTSQSLTAQNYAITVGGGGASIEGGYSSNGIAGSNSQFGALTAAVGGGGGGCESTLYANGDSGGSGGGAGATTTPNSVGSAGSPTSGQGYAGGSSYANGGSDAQGGGGGGAGGAGVNATSYSPGAGGVGTSAYSSWGLATKTGENVNGTVYYAGGGGAGGGGYSQSEGGRGLGGYGGGGAGSSLGDGIATSGMVSTGGGGGAQSWNGISGSGGSGLIIVRYAK